MAFEMPADLILLSKLDCISLDSAGQLWQRHLRASVYGVYVYGSKYQQQLH